MQVTAEAIQIAKLAAAEMNLGKTAAAPPDDDHHYLADALRLVRLTIERGRWDDKKKNIIQKS